MTEQEPQTSTAAPVGTEPSARVLLIGWDAADWLMLRPLLDAGEMPNLKRFLDEGVSGNIATLQPALSPMLWTSIATGKLADKHGILGFAEVDPETNRTRPVTSTSRACKAVWNILSDRARPAGVVNWYASHPAERIEGFVVTDRFAHPTGPWRADEPLGGWSTVPRSVWPDADLDPLAAVRVHPAMITHEQVMAFVPGAAAPESAGWDRVRELRVLLAHCATVHNAATAYIAERPWDFLGIYYDAIDRFAHAFMEFNPPKMAHVSEDDFALYSGVMHECYRFHDLMLGRLMKLVDDRTTVVIVSDHGFHSGTTRPGYTSAIKDGKPASWHRTYGMLAVRGPGIRRGATIHGATLLDVAPTVLNILGLPAARDMDGQALMQIFAEPRLEAERIETYETDDGDTDQDDAVEDDAATSEQMLHQLRQLGYLASDGTEDILVDRARNLGTVYLTTGRPIEALEQFEKIRAIRPGDKGARMSSASALLSLGKLDEAEAIADGAEDSPGRRVMLSHIATRRGDHGAALGHLMGARELEGGAPGLDTQIGLCLSRLERWDDAAEAFERALAIDPDDAEALDAQGVVFRHWRRPEEAVMSHVRSIALLRHRPRTHLHLGLALCDANRVGWAIEAFTEAARLSPFDPVPHARLATVYDRLRPDSAKAKFHKARAASLREQAQARVAAVAERIEGALAAMGGDEQTLTPGASEPARVSVTGEATPADRADEPPGRASEPVVVVSGLPRSGTSLVMQMLVAGGIEALTDEQRGADADNPRGYFELEAVKGTVYETAWLERAPGKAVKVIHALLRTLPPGYRYDVIFMKRSLDEVVASQSVMLARNERRGAALSHEQLMAAYATEYQRIGRWLHAQTNFRVLELSYNRLLGDPALEVAKIPAFLGRGVDVAPMIAAIDPSLYRQRADR